VSEGTISAEVQRASDVETEQRLGVVMVIGVFVALLGRS
jgi:hypothetical protein